MCLKEIVVDYWRGAFRMGLFKVALSWPARPDGPSLTPVPFRLTKIRSFLPVRDVYRIDEDACHFNRSRITIVMVAIPSASIGCIVKAINDFSRNYLISDS